jgi:hypothetical protein
VVRGEIGDGDRKASEWRKDIISIKKGSFNRIVSWFQNFLNRQVGNEDDTSF